MLNKGSNLRGKGYQHGSQEFDPWKQTSKYTLNPALK